jgi:hypothetical protein
MTPKSSNMEIVLVEVKYIRIILSPNLMHLVVFEYLYGGFDA